MAMKFDLSAEITDEKLGHVEPSFIIQACFPLSALGDPSNILELYLGSGRCSILSLLTIWGAIGLNSKDILD